MRVGMAKRRPSARTERRERERAAEKLVRDRERLARLEPGGAPERPIPVDSASQIEPHAVSMGCLRCEGDLRVDEHAAVSVDGASLRRVTLLCARCGSRRDVWFAIRVGLPS
jgi:hypothetical protein